MTKLVLFAGEHLHAEVHNPEAEVLFVTFDHWRRERDGFALRNPSEAVAAAGYADLIVKSARNDWYLNADLAPLSAVLEDFCARYRSARCIAFSMGAYAALRLSRPLRLRRAVLISPQWSVFPGEEPFDPRFADDAAKLSWRLGNLAKVAAPRLRGVVLFDPITEPVDTAHARLISQHLPGMTGVAMAFGGHPASQHLVEARLYNKLRALALDGRDNPAPFRRLHVEARKVAPSYQRRLQAQLAKRRARVS